LVNVTGRSPPKSAANAETEIARKMPNFFMECSCISPRF
jgi:hypothetical protein